MARSSGSREDLLLRAWELRTARAYPALLELLAPVPAEELIADPELGHLFCYAAVPLGRWQQGAALAVRLMEPLRAREDEWLYRRHLNIHALLLF
ncbi:MAG: hypothetical protein H0U67_08490, partial [Gemmatimonadetes bacterium]|nr:hypothetical protein [Gemmatimonadota bacterium]